MSPAAVGKPSTRASAVERGGPVNMPLNGSISNGSAGQHQHGAVRVFPHLDDLVIAKPNVDINSPLRTILLQGELLAKQADTHLDFRRPDIALQEYVSASVIAVEIVPRHPDYLALQRDRGDLHRLYLGLNKRINSQHKKFAEVKEMIKEDNAKSGVKPTSGKQNTSGVHSQIPGAGVEAMNSHVTSVPLQKKTAPAVQPKPDALHGRAVPNANGTKNVSDLAARFARLQNGGPVQDPRIKTRPISISNPPESNSILPNKPESRSTMIRPNGPRELPSVPDTHPRATKIPLDVTIPGMPRPPDAIHHSPLRAVDNPDATNLPSSVSRNPSFLGNGQRDSAPPISTVGPSPYVFEGRSEYFVSPTHSSSENVMPARGGTKVLCPPDSVTITAEELVGYLQQGQQKLKLLIVDLRDRDDFAGGHIMSQATICVEPLTLRSGLSGEELEDSMIIAPTYEQNLFDQRHEFDMLVFYDQSSTSFKNLGSRTEKDNILRDFAAAVYDYGYDKRLKRRPVLLAGGLDSWVDLLGPNSLATLSAGSHDATSAPMIISPRSQGARSQALNLSKRRIRPARVQSNEEQKRWDQILKEESNILREGKGAVTDADELVYARTQEDFLRRFPELPPVQESMVSPAATVPFKRIQDELENIMPRPPARPAPALPRQRSNGITDRGLTQQYAHGGQPSLSPKIVWPGATGLQNSGNVCYMSAAIQLISMTPQLREFLKGLTPGSVPVPAKAAFGSFAGESAPPLQLMARTLGNLLEHMWSGHYNFLNPRTLRGYINAVHCTVRFGERIRDRAFGGRLRQHDSGEFLVWLLDILEDETNPVRHRQPALPADYSAQLGELSDIAAALQSWTDFTTTRSSFLTHTMGTMVVTEMRCRYPGCGQLSRNPQNNVFLSVTIPADVPTPITLEALLRRTYAGAEEESPGFRCLKCKQVDTTYKAERAVRAPEVLSLGLPRTQFGAKDTRVVTWGETINLDGVFFQGPAGSEAAYRGPFIYDVVSMVIHKGTSLDSGHYVTLGKVPNPSGTGSKWFRFDDASVRPEARAPLQFGITETITWSHWLRRPNP